MRHYNSEVKADEQEIKEFLLSNGVDTTKIKLFEPLSDGDNAVVVVFTSCDGFDVNYVRDLLEERVGSLLDVIDIRDTGNNIVALFE